jgi:hypothetical protein
VKLIVFMGAISPANPEVTVVQSIFYDVENRASHISKKAIVMPSALNLNLKTEEP